MTGTERRLEQLETRLAFQEHTIEELNTALTDQWQVINKLKRELARLTDELNEMEQAARDKPHREPPPPHY